jgi:hypothetical protein
MGENCEHKSDEELAVEALSYAGAVIDKAIEFLIGKEIDPALVASALLGGAMGLLTQTMDDGGILRVLDNARESVIAGQFREE